MNKTTNYDLNQWELHDRVMMQDFNADNAKIDAALKAEADARAAADTAERTAREAADTAIQAELVKRGNCKIWTTTYTGTGKYGTGNPTKLTFPELPLFAMIFSDAGDIMILMPGNREGIFHTAGSGSSRCTLSWSGNTVSWYTTSGYVYGQMNSENRKYTVMAFFKAD